MEKRNKQPWIRNAAFDSIYILLPSFVALIIVALLPDKFKSTDELPVYAWVILVLLIDVAHVYSTLFRTYWNKERFNRYRTLYLTVPALCYIAGVFLYTANALWFWRVLAYLAVYHFIRQQYGFMRLYSRGENKKGLPATIDVLAIYAATLYPIIYWHCTAGRNFNWFIEGDFISIDAASVKMIAFSIYLLILVAYVAKEIWQLFTSARFNIPKNLIITGTFLTWYFGIVHFNGDMTFTLLNVVSHGIPYMALIWTFNKSEQAQKEAPAGKHKFYRSTAVFFLLSIFLFAYIEEGLWDGMIWKEHGSIFTIFQSLPLLHSKELLALLIPLLSLPQSTHYVLDGFIWKKQHTA